MKAHVTENFDLVLRWDDDSKCEIIWSACSECEFKVTAKLWFPPGLNYQGSTLLEFSTTCYAYALRFFAEELDKFVCGDSATAVYRGSEDMTITIQERHGQADFLSRTIKVCDLRFEMFRTINMVACDSAFEVTLGRPEDARVVAMAIREVMSTLVLDDTLEAPSRQMPPNKSP